MISTLFPSERYQATCFIAAIDKEAVCFLRSPSATVGSEDARASPSTSVDALIVYSIGTLVLSFLYLDAKGGSYMLDYLCGWVVSLGVTRFMLICYPYILQTLLFCDNLVVSYLYALDLMLMLCLSAYFVVIASVYCLFAQQSIFKFLSYTMHTHGSYDIRVFLTLPKVCKIAFQKQIINSAHIQGEFLLYHMHIKASYTYFISYAKL